MKQIGLLLLFVLLQFWSLAQPAKSQTGVFSKQQRYSRLISVKDSSDCKKMIDSLMASGSNLLPFEGDNELVMDSMLLYKISKYQIFLLKGRLLPSTAEFHYYGIREGKQNLVADFYSAEVEIETLLIKYRVSSAGIIVYGKQWDTAGLDDGSKPPKKLQELLFYP